MVKLVYFAHGVVEDAGDDATVGVAGRSGVALAQAKLADEGLALFVEDEFEAHAIGIVHAADEAVVLLHFCVAGVMALGLRWHRDDFNGWAKNIEFNIQGTSIKALCEAGAVGRKGSFYSGYASHSRSAPSAQDDSAAEIVLLTRAGILYTYRF
jgi:hypothetical protein